MKARMDRAAEQPRFTLPAIFDTAAAELDSIPEGFVEIRIYKSKNALENYDLTTHQRFRGSIGKTAELAAN